jgi:thiamine-phosphate pyrophosphorylase
MTINWRLCFIADSQASRERNIFELVGEAVAGGATLVQLRAKDWSARDILRTARDLRLALAGRKVPLIINDRVDIAFAVGAHGVHLGQDDLPVREARRILGAKRIIGVSVCTPDEAATAEKDGADYIGAGPLFPTPSKSGLPAPLGLEGLRKIRTAVRIPILAIGGITARNAGDVIAAGADGVAVISAITGSPDPRRAASEFIEAIGKLRIRGR